MKSKLLLVFILLFSGIQASAQDGVGRAYIADRGGCRAVVDAIPGRECANRWFRQTSASTMRRLVHGVDTWRMVAPSPRMPVLQRRMAELTVPERSY